MWKGRGCIPTRSKKMVLPCAEVMMTTQEEEQKGGQEVERI